MLWDELPTFKLVSKDHFDKFNDNRNEFRRECDKNVMNPAKESVQLSTPVHKLSIDLATFDFPPPPPSSDLDENESNDTPLALPLSSPDEFAQIDKASHDMCDLDYSKGKRSKSNGFDWK